MIDPVSARSRPASTISSVDLPDPEGPDQADRFAAADSEIDVLEDVNPRGSAAER